MEFQVVTDLDLLKAKLFHQLAKIYGIDKSNVWAIRSGKSWKHLNAASAGVSHGN